MRQRHQDRPHPLQPAAGRAIDRAIGSRADGPILLNSRGARKDRHAATRRLRRLAQTAEVRITRPIRTCSDTFVTTMLDAGVDLRDAQIAAATPTTHHHALRPGTQEPRPPPQLHLGCIHGHRHLTRPVSPAAKPRDTSGIADDSEFGHAS